MSAIEPDFTPARSRDLLLAAASSAGAAVSGITETMRLPHAVETMLAEGLAWSDPDGMLPLQEDAIEPLIDALRCVILAIGNPRPLHRIMHAIDRFSVGDDD